MMEEESLQRIEELYYFDMVDHLRNLHYWKYKMFKSDNYVSGHFLYIKTCDQFSKYF
jgi:hypothetical protein